MDDDFDDALLRDGGGERCGAYTRHGTAAR